MKKEEADSALFKELNPEIAAWSGTMKTNAILADIFDVLTSINANLVAIGSGKHAKKPKPYPRPAKRDKENEKRIGSGGLPPKELHEWIERRRAEFNARNSTGDNNSHSGAAGRTADDHK